MRRSICALAMLCAALASAGADAPFAPLENTPDHVVTMVERAIHRKAEHTRTITHHGGWTRIDKIEGPQRGTEFFAHRGMTDIRIYGSGLSTTIVRGGDNFITDNVPRNTGERQTHLGESCTVWDVKRMKATGPKGLTWLSCVTGDGIEIWSKAVSEVLLSSSEAIKIERRPVAAEEARPPRDLISLDWWDKPEAGPIKPTYETVMTLSGHSAQDVRRVRVTRQHHAWRSVEETANGVRDTYRTEHHSGRMGFHVTNEGGGRQRLIVSRTPPPPPDAPKPEPREPKDLGRGDTVLGERCRWFDMTPGMMDAGIEACQTADGITLKEVVTSRGSHVVWTAVKLERREIGLSEVTPPAELRDPKLWGIE